MKVKKSIENGSWLPRLTCMVFMVLIPTENANQYTKTVNAGFTTAQPGPITAPLYVLISSFFASRKICFPNPLCSLKIEVIKKQPP